MNKALLFLMIVSIPVDIFSQSIMYRVATAKVGFDSDAPLELISANSNELTGLLNTEDRSFAFRVSMNSFDGFNSTLQKTHFRENYMETEKYPYATFQGKIIEDIDFSRNGTYIVHGNGVLDVHGVKKARTIKCNLIVDQGAVHVTSEFTVLLVDHKIKIPRVLNRKIAEAIQVTVEMVMKPE